MENEMNIEGSSYLNIKSSLVSSQALNEVKIEISSLNAIKQRDP